MDAGAASADPLQAPRPEDGEEKPKPSENQDDGYETSNSGEARRKPSSAEGSPAPPAEPSPPPEPEYEAIMRQFPPAPPPFRQFDQPPPPPEPDYQHFPFPKYPTSDPYAFKREPDAPYDMSQHQPLQQHHPHNQFGPPIKRDDMYNGIKRECEDPYSFVEEEAMCAMLGQQPQHQSHMHHDHQHHMMLNHQLMVNQPKKRGRKKKIKDENGMELKPDGSMEGTLVPRPVKERKKHDRFNGMSEEEVSRRTLPDHLTENLDIIIIGINPGLFAAYKGHHYAGPGNHFWKCLYLSGLTREQMSADEDYKLLSSGIGFTNMVSRPTKGSADLTRREIKEGSAILLEKLQLFRPKVAVFNGKLIYEVFSGKKDFCFGKQPDTVAGTNTYMWVMPSSSARCAQLPRAADKVPYYAALKKFRDFLNNLHPRLDDSELVFPDTTSRRPQEEMEIRRLTMEPEPGDTILLEDGTEVPLKKKRGRPKKVKLENGETAPPTPRAPRPRPAAVEGGAGGGAPGEQPPKKKRGRPKKIRPEEQQFLLQQQQQVTGLTTSSEQQQSAPMLQQQQVVQQQQQQAVQQQLPSLNPPLQYMTEFNDSNNINLYQDQPYFQPPTHPGGGMEGGMELGGLGGAAPGQQYGTDAPYRSPRHMYERSARHQRPQFGGSPAAFSGPSPPRGSYGSPARGPFTSARSPLYAASPAAFQQPSPAYNQPSPAYNQPSPAYNQASPAYNQASPAGYQQASPVGLSQARFSQSPAPLSHSYSNSPVPQSHPFSRSPGPGSGGGTQGGAGTPFPSGDVDPYTPSPHTPASQQPSPIEPAHHQGGSTASNSGSAFTHEGSLSAELSGGGMSPAASPPLPLDFEPPAPRSRPASATPTHIESEGVGDSGGFMYESSPRLYPLPLHSPQDNKDLHNYHQDNGSGVSSSPRLEQLHQHPSMYPTNFNRSTPPVSSEGPFSPHAGPFRPSPASNNPSNEHPGSPGDYSGVVKTKSQDVASKSLSGLESLVDQIPSIAEGGGGGGGVGADGVGGGGGGAGGDAAAPALPDYAPALYQPYAAYPAAPYANNGYGGGFVGYGGGWAGQLMRPTPGYLSDWQYPPYPPAVPPYPYNNYYNQYTPPHTHQTHYLSTQPLLELHKNSEPPVPPVPSVPSVGFGGFC